MTNRYISIGIDHGTTNSCIAVMDSSKPRVIKPGAVESVMPSAVYIDRWGRKVIGRSAIQAMMMNEPDEGDGYTGYKIRIGQDDRYAFAAAQQVMTAPELGAHVIGELLKVYREQTRHDPNACVITVPAKFEHNACEGTRQAAKLAGLQFYPLLQEPIAAALAYGFSTTDKRAHWIIFDLGGGTLDVSLVIVREGQMVVPEEGHAGDTRLGGRKFDREVLSYVLGELSKQYSLKSFTENNPVYRGAWGRLMLEVEEAKISLSNREEAKVEVNGVLCKDENGKPVKVEVPITRTQYEKMIAADVEKAVHICQMLLNKNRLTGKDVDRLILIGGPTKTPYLKRVLHDRLKINLDDSIDPMTAVAQGAALYATTVELPEELRTMVAAPGATNGQVQIRLEYERRSKLPTYNVAGTVEGAAVAGGGLSVEIKRTDGLWSSGNLPVDEFGMFSAEVMLIERDQPAFSRFTTTALDRAGKPLATVEEPEIWYPFPEGEVRLANSLRVAVRGNKTEVLIKQGTALPGRGSGKFETVKQIRKGSIEDVLRIPVLEAVTHLLGSEDEHADCSVHVGTLTIVGSDERVTRDLPAGSEIDLEIHQDASREIRAVAYVPLLDDEFEAVFKTGAFDVDVDQVAERFENLKASLEQVEKLQQEKPLPEVGKILKTLHDLDVIEQIGKELARAKEGERDSCYRAYRGVLELAGAMNQIHAEQISVRIEHQIEQLQSLAQQNEAQELARIKNDYQAARDSQGAPDLSQFERSLDELNWQVQQRPIFNLAHALFSFPETFRGTQEQLDSYKDGVELFKEISEIRKNGGRITQSHIDRAQQAFDRLLRNWPELPAWMAEEAKKIGEGIRDVDMSDIEKRH